MFAITFCDIGQSLDISPMTIKIALKSFPGIWCRDPLYNAIGPLVIYLTEDEVLSVRDVNKDPDEANYLFNRVS